MKKLLKIFVLIALVVLNATTAAAGEIFNGLVTDGKGQPIKGAKVWLTDKRQYAKSDKKGHFGLESVSPGDTIHLEYQKVVHAIPVGTVNGMRVIIVDATATYNPDAELVNHGYGWVSRRDYTGSSNGISGARLVATGQSTLTEALRGLVPGLDISRDGRITLRGHSSLISDDQPLFIIDGNIVGSLDMINLNMIDHVEIQKDGSMYGTRGSGGAILVFTKRGNEKER
ncbi:MAG: TonB-dependent receptor plug domain-containing protein [Muribaculaceae bacterium]|nr:TonB-dependent receptor plug domain-containing protein [Muribaculaceae bacterium]